MNAQVGQVLKVVSAVYETIVEMGPMGAPAGHVYAALMTAGCTLAQYEQLEALLIDSGLVRKQGQLLFACDPSRKSLTA